MIKYACCSFVLKFTEAGMLFLRCIWW